MAERVDTVTDRLPAGLRADWPVARQAVVGERDSTLAHLEYWVARAVLASLSSLPIQARNVVVGALARLARRFDRRRCEAARVFLRQAFGSELEGSALEARVLQAWRHFFHVTIETAGFDRHVDVASIREHFSVSISDDVRDVLAGGHGSIVVTGHIGNWEIGSAALPWLGFDPVYSIAKAPRNRPLSIHMQAVRERRGIRLLPRRGAIKDAPAVIAAGGSLAMLLDQRARKKPVLAPFFGRLARCDRSAGVLLKRLAAPIVFGACYRTARPYHYELVLSSVLWPKEIAREPPEEIARRVNVELERLIMKHPEQYFWLHDRYRGT